MGGYPSHSTPVPALRVTRRIRLLLYARQSFVEIGRVLYPPGYVPVAYSNV